VIEIRTATGLFQSSNFASCNFRPRIMVVYYLLRPGNGEKAQAIYFDVFLDGMENVQR